MVSNEVIKKAVDLLIKKPETYSYFFDNLKSPDWIGPLSDRGFFAHPPGAVLVQSTVSFPIWVESKYLLRVSKFESAQSQICNIIQSLPQSDNPNVISDCLKIAFEFPTHY